MKNDTKGDIYITPFYGNWAVKLNGKKDPMSLHNLKSDAIRVGTQISKRLKTKLIIMEDENPVN